MCAPKNLHKFLVYAKSCACDLACKYVDKTNHGQDASDLLNRLRLLSSYIKTIQDYLYPSCKDYYYQGFKFLNGKKVFTSKNNSLYLISKDQKIEISSQELNCLTEEQICELANKIRSICANC